MPAVLHVLPFLPSPGLAEPAGAYLTYSPSFVDLGKVKLRVEALHVRWCATRPEDGFSKPFLQKATELVKGMIRGKVRVEAWTDGRFRVVASDNWGQYTYEFTANPSPSRSS